MASEKSGMSDLVAPQKQNPGFPVKLMKLFVELLRL